MEEGLRRIVEAIVSGEIDTPARLDAAKRREARRLGLDRFIRNSEILEKAYAKEKKAVIGLLQKKPTRTLSGVAVVAAMTSPHKCPHGKCKYCPGGPDINVPQSYTGKEPAARRAIQCGYDPYRQVLSRLYQLWRIGHPVDKAELVVMGGTLTSRMLDYQEWFVRSALEAMNDFERQIKSMESLGEEEFWKSAPKRPFRYMQDVQKENESAMVRCVGITFEPRPDWAKRQQIDYMLSFGVTRVELGVQNPDDRIYERFDRGHTVEDVASATARLKDSALKVCYHLMPGLDGYDPLGDSKMFEMVFSDSRFKPDMIKIYPCIVMGGTELSKMVESGEFEPLTTEQAVKIIAKAKMSLPKWVRTMRIMRDIPSNTVEAGIKNSNLGQLVYEHMLERGMKCDCIRCREVGRRMGEGIHPDPQKIKPQRIDYEACGGSEIFLSFEDTKQDILIGFARLRIPNAPHRPEIGQKTGLIRELHVYGPQVELGEKPVFEWQHRGYGGELMNWAKNIAAQEFGMDSLAVISGIGARQYYRRLGYGLRGPYMMSRLG